MARKGFNRNQPRDAHGRFASGGGSGGGGGSKKGGKGRVATGGKGAKRGRTTGASGRKVGSRAQQQQNAAAQAARTKRFSSKAPVNAAREIWKQDSRALRVADKRFQNTPTQYTAAARRQAESQLHKTRLSLQGRTSELKSYLASERKTRQRDMQFAAQKAVDKGRERAGKTLKGKLAAAKRLLTGGKRKRR